LVGNWNKKKQKEEKEKRKKKKKECSILRNNRVCTSPVQSNNDKS